MFAFISSSCIFQVYAQWLRYPLSFISLRTGHGLICLTLNVSFSMIKNLSTEFRMRIDNVPNVRISGIRISGSVLYCEEQTVEQM